MRPARRCRGPPAAERFNAGLAAYVERDAALARAADESVSAFLVARRNWIRATNDWSRAAARYA